MKIYKINVFLALFVSLGVMTFVRSQSKVATVQDISDTLSKIHYVKEAVSDIRKSNLFTLPLSKQFLDELLSVHVTRSSQSPFLLGNNALATTEQVDVQVDKTLQALASSIVKYTILALEKDDLKVRDEMHALIGQLYAVSSKLVHPSELIKSVVLNLLKNYEQSFNNSIAEEQLFNEAVFNSSLIRENQVAESRIALQQGLSVPCGNDACSKEIDEMFRKIKALKAQIYISPKYRNFDEKLIEEFLSFGRTIFEKNEHLTPDEFEAFLSKEHGFWGPYQTATENTAQDMWIHTRFPFSVRKKAQERIFTVGFLNRHPVTELRHSSDIETTSKKLLSISEPCIELNGSESDDAIKHQVDTFFSKIKVQTRSVEQSLRDKAKLFISYVRDLKNRFEGKTVAEIKSFMNTNGKFWKAEGEIFSNVWFNRFETFAVFLKKQKLVFKFYAEHPYISYSRDSFRREVILKDEINERFKYAQSDNDSFVIPARMTPAYEGMWNASSHAKEERTEIMRTAHKRFGSRAEQA